MVEEKKRVETNKSDLLSIFIKKWLEYVKACKEWADKLLELLHYQYRYYPYVDAHQRVNNILEDYHIPQSNNLDKLHAEVIKAAQPILDLLFTPNERWVIPKLTVIYSKVDLHKLNNWYNNCQKITTNMFERIEGAKNKLAFDEQKEQHDDVALLSEKKEMPVFKVPPDTKWDDITIKFVDGHNVDIIIKDKIIRSDYKQMGFENKKSRYRVPNKQWGLLQELAQHHGELSWQLFPVRSNKKEVRITKEYFGMEHDEENEKKSRLSYKRSPNSNKKHKSLLSIKLRAYFGIDEDPFYLYKEDRAYKIKINLIPE